MKFALTDMVVRSPEDGNASGAAEPIPGGDGDPTSPAAGEPGPLPEGSLLGGAADPDKPAEAAEAEETEEQKTARLAAETPEQKTEREAAEAKTAEDAEKAATEAKAALLKTYDEIKLPDGMAADQPVFADFKAECAELELPADKAQRLVDKIAPKIADALEAPYQMWIKTQGEWVAECKSNPETGGADYEKNIATSAKGIDALFPDKAENKAFRDMLALTGAGNNPVMFKAMLRWGKTVSEGSPVGGRGVVEAPSLAERLYGGKKE